MKQEKIEEWKERLSKDGLYLKRIKTNQTPELCEIAIRQNPMALEFVKEPSLELCQLAVSLDKHAIKVTPYNEETKDWFLDYVRERLSMLPDLLCQPEVLQWEFLWKYPMMSHAIEDATCRIGLEKAKGWTPLYALNKEHAQCFEIFYAQIRMEWETILHGSELSVEENQELMLMISPFKTEGLPVMLEKELKEKRRKVRFDYIWDEISSVFVKKANDEIIEPHVLVQQIPHALGLAKNRGKDYRLCRLAKRLDPQVGWYSPYHVLEYFSDLSTRGE